MRWRGGKEGKYLVTDLEASYRLNLAGSKTEGLDTDGRKCNEEERLKTHDDSLFLSKFAKFEGKTGTNWRKTETL
jgi:hypothetical protein